jgi:quercetin dioxygenase-like cupin family protein
LIAFSLTAQAPVPLAHGNVPGEPHHHLKIENEYVRAYYVEVAPHEATQLHQHDHDYIFVSLGPADVINAVLNKPEVHLVLKDGETHFARGGFAHVARNLSDTPFRNVTIELLKPQGEPRNICEKIIAGPLGDCAQSGPYHQGTEPSSIVSATRLLLETDEMGLVRSGLAPNERGGNACCLGPSGEFAKLLVVYGGSALRIDSPGEQSKTVRIGEVIWLPAGICTPKMVNLTEHSPSQFLMLAFKDSRNGTKP